MSPEKKTARVVLIEDHTMVRQLFAQLVREELGLTLAADCATVAEGAAALLREKPDLAIVDWMLPDGRGFDLVRRVKPRVPGIRWLLVSSNQESHLVREAARLGVQGVVMKSSDLGLLREAIRQLLVGKNYYCPLSAALLVDSTVLEPSRLTPRECEVLRGFASGENPKAMADRLGVTAKTVQNHLSILKEKLELREPAELVNYARKHGYIE